jgi:Ca-activated chloride channel family protein
LISILLTAFTDPLSIGKINRVKKEAQEAYLKADYQTAIQKYTLLIDSLHIDEPEVNINLANAYFQVNDSARAQTTYQGLLDTDNAVIRSKAYQQLGILQHKQGNLEMALHHLKEAIKADPKNGSARYDYEMLKKKLKEKQQQQVQNQDQQNKDQKDQKDQNKDQQKEQDQNKDQNKDQKKEQDQKSQDQDNAKKDQDNQEKGQQDKKEDQQQRDKKDQGKEDKSGEEGKEKEEDPANSDQQSKEEQAQKRKEEVKKSLEEMNISEETARMIMEAMKNNEVQYLQQNQRKPTQSRDKSKPDW